MEKGHIEIFTDGSSLGNPGPSGYGFILRYWEPIKDDNQSSVIKEIEGYEGFRLSTNNRMELMAGIKGLCYILDHMYENYMLSVNYIDLTTDSKYFCDTINKGWIYQWQRNNWVTSSQMTVKNRDLWELILKAQKLFHQFNIKLKIIHIPGHQGYEFNERADKLCTAASRDSKNHLIDEVYEESVKNKNKRG